MFDVESNVVACPGAGTNLEDVERELSRLPEEQRGGSLGSENWNFIIIRLRQGTDAASVQRSLETRFVDLGIDAVVDDWSTAAGSSVALAAALRVVYNVGLLLLVVVVLLIVANTLGIGVMQIGPPLLAIPADPCIPLGQLQCGSSKAKPAQPAVGRADEVAQLHSDQRPRTLRMFACHQLVPQPHLLRGAHQDHFPAL